MDFSVKSLVYSNTDAILVLFPIIKPLSSFALKWKEVRGTVFFIIGVICIIFFDHDFTHLGSDHHEGKHKSLFIHRIYELFTHFGLSDHKVGVLVLLVAVCADAGYGSLSRTLVATIGGIKRFYCFQSLTSLVILTPLFIFYQLFGADGAIEKPDMSNPSEHGRNSFWFLWLVFTCSIFNLDFYVTNLLNGRLNSHHVSDLSKRVLIGAGIVCSLFWSNKIKFDSSVLGMAQSEVLSHQLSIGVIIGALSIVYASSLLTASKTGHGPDGTSSGHFVGYSPDGLPLFTAGQTPSHGFALLNDPNESGLWYHIRITLRGILSGQASKRIFVFLCINLSFAFVELFWGVWTNSLGLISDGFHMFFDSAALVGGLYAAVVSHWKPTRVFSYGYYCAEILSGFINALFLLVISFSVFFNALSRIHKPPEIKTDRLMVISVLGLLVNLVGVLALGHAHSHGGGSKPCSSHGHSHGSSSHGHSHGSGRKDCHSHSHNDFGHSHDDHGHQHGVHTGEDANLRGVYLHVLADTLGSVSVIFSSFLVSTYGWNIADPICSIFIAFVIGYSAIPLLTDTMSLLTMKVPNDSRLDVLMSKILTLDEVVSVLNPFVWSRDHTSCCVCLTVHIVEHAPEQIVLSKMRTVVPAQEYRLPLIMPIHYPDGKENRVVNRKFGQTLYHAMIKDIVQLHLNSISHLTIQIQKETFVGHTQTMGLHLHPLSRFAKSIESSASRSCGSHHHQHQDANFVSVAIKSI